MKVTGSLCTTTCHGTSSSSSERVSCSTVGSAVVIVPAFSFEVGKIPSLALICAWHSMSCHGPQLMVKRLTYRALSSNNLADLPRPLQTKSCAVFSALSAATFAQDFCLHFLHFERAGLRSIIESVQM